jgi:hypothetical protein
VLAALIADGPFAELVPLVAGRVAHVDRRRHPPTGTGPR